MDAAVLKPRVTSDQPPSSSSALLAGLPRGAVLTAALIVGVLLLGFLFTRNLVDFPVYYAAGRSLLEGRTDLYAPDFARGPVMDYRYPPLFLVALIPLWLLPYSVAAYLWYLCSVLEIAGCVWVLKRLIGSGTPAKAWLLSGFLVAQYFVMIVHYGNAHLLAVFLMFAALYLVLTKRDPGAAVLMALSITIKLVPVLLLPYFALKRKWRFLGLTAVALIVLNLAPALFFGFGKNLDLLKVWSLHVAADDGFHEANGPINLSLRGHFRRYLSQIDYSQRIDGDTRYPAVNLFSFESDRVAELGLLLGGICFLSGFALIWWRSGRIGQGERSQLDRGARTLIPLEIGLMICLMLLLGPLTSKIYFIALLWPAVFLSSFAFQGESPAARFGRYAMILAAITNSVLPLLQGRSTQRLLLVLGVDLYVTLLLTIAVGFVLWSSGSTLRATPSAQRTEDR